MAAGQVTTAMRERAERLAAIVPRLSRGRSKRNGQAFYLMPSSRPDLVYYTSELGCTCPGFRQRGVCAHQEACRLVAQRAEAVRIAEAQRRGQPCKDGCGERATTLVGRCERCFERLVGRLEI